MHAHPDSRHRPLVKGSAKPAIILPLGHFRHIRRRPYMKDGAFLPLHSTSKIHPLRRWPPRLENFSNREESDEPEALFAFVSLILALSIVAAGLISTLL